jgi:hypothetical protein
MENPYTLLGTLLLIMGIAEFLVAGGMYIKYARSLERDASEIRADDLEKTKGRRLICIALMMGGTLVMGIGAALLSGVLPL